MSRVILLSGAAALALALIVPGISACHAPPAAFATGYVAQEGTLLPLRLRLFDVCEGEAYLGARLSMPNGSDVLHHVRVEAHVIAPPGEGCAFDSCFGSSGPVGAFTLANASEGLSLYGLARGSDASTHALIGYDVAGEGFGGRIIALGSPASGFA